MDLALNNLQRLICHKTHQTKPSKYHLWCPIRLGLQDTRTESLQWGKSLLSSILNMTLNNLMLELWGTRGASLLLLMPVPLWTEVVEFDRVLSTS